MKVLMDFPEIIPEGLRGPKWPMGTKGGPKYFLESLKMRFLGFRSQGEIPPVGVYWALGALASVRRCPKLQGDEYHRSRGGRLIRRCVPLRARGRDQACPVWATTAGPSPFLRRTLPAALKGK